MNICRCWLPPLFFFYFLFVWSPLTVKSQNFPILVVYIKLISLSKCCEALQSWVFHHIFAHVCYVQFIYYRYQKIQIHYSQIVANQMMMKMLIKSLLWHRLIIILWLVWSRSTPQFIKIHLDKGLLYLCALCLQPREMFLTCVSVAVSWAENTLKYLQ